MRFIHRLGIGFLDLIILTAALTYIYLGVLPDENIGLWTTDAFVIFATVILLYLVVVGFVSLCLTYMREDNKVAMIVKSLVSTIMVVALFNWIIFPLMWFLGYQVRGDVELILTITAIIRVVIKSLFNRRYGGGE